MKKLLLLPLLLLFFPASAGASSLDTYEYRQLEAYVTYLDGLVSADGFSNEQKDNFRTTLRLRRDAAYESIGIAFDQFLTGFYRERGSATRGAFRKADRQRSRAKHKAKRWYRQNKSRPAARKILRKKIRRSGGRISRQLARKLIIIEESFQGRRYNLIEARTLQNGRVGELWREGLSIIDSLPSGIN